MRLARRPAALTAVLLTAGALGAGVAFAAAGDQDPSFNGGAARLVDFPGITDDSVAQVALAPDGSIAIAGSAYSESGQGFALARLTAAGAPLATFGDDGAETDFSVTKVDSPPEALAFAADGDLLVGLRARGPELGALRSASWGGDDPTSDAGFAVARYHPDGSFAGVSRIALPGLFGAAGIVAIVPQADGTTLVLGSTLLLDGHGAFVRVRLDADGHPDPTYGVNGVAIDTDADATAAAAGPQGAGSLIFLGTSTDGTGAVLRRYLADGTVDPSYGGSFDLGLSSDLRGGTVLADGSVLGVDDTAVRRFTANGTPDATYGGDGTADLTFLGAGENGFVGVAAQPDGKAIVIARVGDHIVVGRLTAAGTPDPTFGTGGTVSVPQPAGLTESQPGGVAVQPDGKVVVAGSGGAEGVPSLRAPSASIGIRGEQLAFVARLDADNAPADTTTTTTTTTTTAAATTTPPAAGAPAPIAAQSGNPLPVAKACVSRRSFKIRLRIPKGAKPINATVKVNGKRVKVVTGSRLRAAIDLEGLPKGRFTVSITVKLPHGKTLKGTRRYLTCTPKSGDTIPTL